MMNGINISIRNIANREHLDEHRVVLGIRKYHANDKKHKHNRDNSYGKGKIASPMDLNDTEAQELLNKAIYVKGKLYAKKKEKYYAFQCEQDVIYHGYIADDLGEDIVKELDVIDWE